VPAETHPGVYPTNGVHPFDSYPDSGTYRPRPDGDAPRHSGPLVGETDVLVVPRVANAWAYVSPGASSPSRRSVRAARSLAYPPLAKYAAPGGMPSSYAVTVWATSLSFTRSTVPPASTVRRAGSKAKSSVIDTRAGPDDPPERQPAMAVVAAAVRVPVVAVRSPDTRERSAPGDAEASEDRTATRRGLGAESVDQPLLQSFRERRRAVVGV